MEWTTVQHLDLRHVGRSSKPFQPHAATFHPNQALVAVAAGTYVIEYDAYTGSKISSINIGAPVVRMSYSPTSGHAVVAILEDCTIRSCDFDTEQTWVLHSPEKKMERISIDTEVYLALTPLQPVVFFGFHRRMSVTVLSNFRLKAGRGESLYPRSSFSINCTGDACKGDVVFFKQRVHKKQGNMVGKRSVAGRIVKESYGASKQQHTFTIEVLWSKPLKNLPPLSTLLVKGRNLYRFGTFRQPWRSEAERSKVLSEKHDRGEEARHVRKLRQTEIASINDRGTKRQKLSHGGPSTSKHQTRIDKQKSSRRRGTAPVKKNKTAYKKDVRFKKTESRRPIQPPDRLVHSDHHLQEASSSFPYDTTSSSSFPPFGFSVYGPYNNGRPRPSLVMYQPPRYHHHHYEQPAPRYRFG